VGSNPTYGLSSKKKDDMKKKTYVYRPLVKSICDGKKKYERKEIADWFLKEGLHSYHCPECGYWHIGH
jgi:hypothetical protein